MAKRKGITQKTRFEVFKRDKFTCQYCGRKAPDVVLNVDHINPVDNGGGNEILNLLTSCFDCNSGKKHRLLGDNAAIEKQRVQIELLADRKEQLKLMMEWKQSLENIDSQAVDELCKYINHKISPRIVTDGGRENLLLLVKKHSFEKVLSAIDKSALQYLKYNNEGCTVESAELFYSKISGVIYFDNLPPLKKKLGYINAIGKKCSYYWNDKTAYTYLNIYVSTLKEAGWNEERIMWDLDEEIVPLTKSGKSFSQWKSVIDGWIADIKNWD